MSPEQQKDLEITREAIRRLVAKGLVYDTGKRKWQPETRTYEILWQLTEKGRAAAAQEKAKQEATP
jgi:hypothetical protein